MGRLHPLLREDDQVLAIHTKRRKQSNFKKDSHKEHRPTNKFQNKRENNQKKYCSKYQCYNCHKIGYLARECLSKHNNNERHHAHLAEDEEEAERPRKRLKKEEDVKQYVLLSTLWVCNTWRRCMAY